MLRDLVSIFSSCSFFTQWPERILVSIKCVSLFKLLSVTGKKVSKPHSNSHRIKCPTPLYTTDSSSSRPQFSWCVSTPALTTNSSLETLLPQALAIWPICTEPSCNSWSWELTLSPFQPWLKRHCLRETHLDPLFNVQHFYLQLSRTSHIPVFTFQTIYSSTTLGTSLLRTHQAQSHSISESYTSN